MSIAIIGAGIAGLRCAAVLADAGRSVEVFEKSRGLGGRMATRRSDDTAFDHGAQYFHARDERFLRALDGWLEAGVVAEWPLRLARATPVGPAPIEAEHRHYVAVPTMSALGRYLAGDTPVHRQCRIERCSGGPGAWSLVDEQGTCHGPYTAVILAVPPADAAGLLPGGTPLGALVEQVEMAPCWAVLARFHTPLPFEFDAVLFDKGIVAWGARNNSKPFRPEPESWVIHAGAEWSHSNLDKPPGAIKSVLMDAFFHNLAQRRHLPVDADCHRWRYARVVEGDAPGARFDAASGLGLCGDWLEGRSNVENAYLSGQRLAEAILADGC